MEEELLNEETIENNTEFINENNSEDIVQSDEVIDNVDSDQEIIQDENVQNEQSENDLLMEYIKSQLLEEQISEETNNVQDDGNNVTGNSSDVDIYQPLKDSIDLLYQEQLNTNMNIEAYLSDNTMQSKIEDISLTNQLLIVVFIGILFTALLNFSRRIF